MAAIKATATLTITTSVDIISTTIYYLLQSSTANPPQKPTADPPGGNWSTTEPAYTEGSTNTLYTVTKTKYSGNIPGTNTDFEYTPVSKSTSYEAAKAAYTKAVNAQNTANTANTNANSAKEYTDNAKNNYGYQYKKDIIIYGENTDRYYPVYMCFGDQNVPREILIKRGYSEQAPSDWNTSTHKGALTLRVKANFGGWGGATYKLEILDFSEMYSTQLADVYVNQCSGYGIVFYLRGGGTTGAAYHIYSDQQIVYSASDNSWHANLPYIGSTNAGGQIFGWNGGTAESPTYKWICDAAKSAVNTSRLNSLQSLVTANSALNTANFAANKVIISANTPSTPASPYEQLWYDTVNNVYKKYFPAEYESGQEVIPAGWREVTNTIAYIDDIASDAKDALEEAKGINTKISESISNYDDLIRNYIQDKVQAAFSLSKNQAQISIMKTLFNTTKQPGETWYEGTAVKKEGNTVTSSQAGAVGDYYLNNETGDIFKCTTAGTLSTAVWSYERSILDSGGGSLNNVTTYFKFTSDDLLIGKDSYNHKLSLQPDRILMKYYDPNTSKWVDISWWNSTQFVANYIQAIENIITNSIDISNQIKLGNFIFKKNNDGSLSLKIGG